MQEQPHRGLAADTVPPLAPKFELDRELGSGTSGRVWLGVLTDPFARWPAGFEVAVKVLHPERETDPDALSRLRIEAEAGSQVLHPSLVTVLHHGSDERGSFLVMEYVPGHSLLEELTLAGPLPEPLVRSIGRQLAGALAALHEAGWLHGDVKPANVRLDAQGAAVLVDLGFVRRPDDAIAAAQPGSLAYLAPELARGEAASSACDVFALGIVLYELATGVHPFAGGSGSSTAIAPADADRLLTALAESQVPPPSRRVPQLSPFLDHLLGQLLARDPRSRPEATQLERILTEGEQGAWWRSRIAFGTDERRDTMVWSGEHLVPFVGRRTETAALVDAFRAIAGSAAGGSAVWLEGSPGTGKSRVVAEFVARVRASADPPLYLYGRCSEWMEERPGQPVRSLLRRWLRLPRETAPGERERALLERLLPPAIAETLTQVLDPRFDGATKVAVEVGMATWLAELGRTTPLVVFLDDVGWAGQGTLDLLSRLAEELSETRLLLVLGLRTDASPREPEALGRLRARLDARVPTRHLELGPLDESDVLAVVEELFHPSVPRLRLARVLWERSHGSPGLVAEILRTLVSRRQAVPGPEAGADLKRGLRLRVAPDDLPLPRSVSRLIADRYRELPPDQRLWLQRLSVVGGHIEPEFLVRAFGPTTPSEVDEMLAGFVREEWLVAVGARYRFARPAQREAVYRSLRPDRRVRIHAAAARAMRPGLMAHPSLSAAFQRAFHLRAAAEHEELLGMLRPLVASVLEHGHPQRVHTLSTWGLEAIDSLPRTDERDRLRIELLEAAADAADRLGNRKTQRERLDQLADLDLDPTSDPVAVGRVYLLHGRFAASTGQYGLARGMLRNAGELLGEGGDRSGEADALRRLAHIQADLGDAPHARRLTERSLALAESDEQRALGQLSLATIDILEDRVEPAQRRVDRALQLLRTESGGPRDRGPLAAAYLVRSRCYRQLGRPRRALASVLRAARLAKAAGERRLESEIGARLGRQLVEVNRTRDAELRLREALLLADEIEYPRGQALASLFLGTLLAEASDPEARALLQRATSLAGRTGLGRIEALGLAIRARLERQEGQLDAALALAERAGDLIERFGAELADRIVVAATRSLLLEESGHPNEARDVARALRRTVRRENDRIGTPVGRQRHHRAYGRLLTAALSPDGLVYPRVRLADLPDALV